MRSSCAKKLKEAPYKAVFEKAKVDAMDVICTSPEATSIKKSPETTKQFSK